MFVGDILKYWRYEKNTTNTPTFLTVGLYAQTGPGGVGTNDGSSDLIIWFDPTNGVSTTNTSVDSWANSAGVSALNLSESGGQRPTFVSNAVNGYPEISFNGSNQLRTGLTLTTSNFVTDQASSFVVNRPDNTTQTSSIYFTDPLEDVRFSAHVPWNGDLFFDMGVCCGADSRIAIYGSSGLTTYSIWSYDVSFQYWKTTLPKRYTFI